MNAVTHVGELVDDVAQFFAPVSSDLVDSLVGEYRGMRERIEALAAAVEKEEHAGALTHFINGNLRDDRNVIPHHIGNLFDLAGAIGHLNGMYWNKALHMTDVLDYMPQARRREWDEQIRNPLGIKANSRTGEKEQPPLPEFEEETVRSTLSHLLHSRSQFFAERIDGIFRALSKTHVTNCPEGFNKRMILNRAITHYDTVDHDTAGVINDLRCVIAKFMGREEPKYYVTSDTVSRCRYPNGQWHTIDGGALRMRIYNGVGTAHLEVHPDIAWRLNGVLASIYPAAIPEKNRTRPKRQRKIKDFDLMERPLPFSVIGLLSGMKPAVRPRENPSFQQSRFADTPHTLQFGHGDHDKHALAEAEKVLEAIGGVPDKEGNVSFWRFDYEPRQVINEIVVSGCIPDHKSHQFYPTPTALAERAVDLAGIGPEDDCLEPSAGTGNLAELIHGAHSLCCVEVSPLHCKILEAKGFKPLTTDFLKWHAPTGFDRIVMNPPFDQGRWLAHLEHAASMLRRGGRLVAILPSGAKNKDPLPDLQCQWYGPYDNQFAGASVSVVILVADRSYAS